jgi:hypothetical protein
LKEKSMKKLRGRRPSPAMIVAVVALSLSLAGTGVAATISVLNSSEKKQVKKIARKQANKRITKRAGNLNVASADSADNVLAAEVPNGCNTVSGGTGGITAAAAGTECNVTFPRSITNCAIVLGTLLDFPGGGETTYRKLAGGTQVQVSRRDSAGGSNTAGAFSIAAICPA